MVLPAEAEAQTQELYMGSEVRPIRINIGGTYQQYSDESRGLTQVSFPFSAFIPLTRQFALSLITNPVLVNGEAIESLQGLSDAQVALSYYQPIGDGSVVISFSSNVPSGKRELTEDEFATSALLSQDFYGFYVPVLGQGLNLSPGLTVAYPLSDQVAAGIGASYQLKGGFKPVENMTDSFTPGDELLITGGFDFKLGTSWALSTNVTYTMYAADQLGDVEVFESGDQISAAIQLIGDLSGNHLRLITRYRSKAKSVLPVGNEVVTAPRSIPEQVQLFGTYNVRIQDGLRAMLIGRARYFGDTDFFENRTLFDVGAAPQFAFSDNVSAVLRFMYTFGSFPGVELGGGLAITI